MSYLARGLAALSAVLFLTAASAAGAQVLPGGGGECDEQCITNYGPDGEVVGHGCIGGGDRGRKNCYATVGDCTTEPCGGFAIVDATGAVGPIQACSRVSAEESLPRPAEPRQAFGGDQMRELGARVSADRLPKALAVSGRQSVH